MRTRILLVFDDFIESEKWQKLLQKMGFEVDSIRNEVSLMGTLLSLRPDAVFILGMNILLNPIRILEKLKNQSWFNGKVLIFESPSRPIQATELTGFQFDGLLPLTEFDPVERLEILSQLLDISFEDLYQKYQSSQSKGDKIKNTGAQASLREGDQSFLTEKNSLSPERDSNLMDSDLQIEPGRARATLMPSSSQDHLSQDIDTDIFPGDKGFLSDKKSKDKQWVRGRGSERTMEEYKKFAKTKGGAAPIQQTSFRRQDIEELIKKTNRTLQEEDMSLLEKKRAFVRALFKGS